MLRLLLLSTRRLTDWRSSPMVEASASSTDQSGFESQDRYDDSYSPHHTHWFGTPWPRPDLPAPVCAEERYRIEVPVGQICETGCGQRIEAGDSGVRMAGHQFQHVECFLRTVICPWDMGLLPPPHEHGEDRRAEGKLILDHIRANPFA